jgi:hypothetical protein
MNSLEIFALDNKNLTFILIGASGFIILCLFIYLIDKTEDSKITRKVYMLGLWVILSSFIFIGENLFHTVEKKTSITIGKYRIKMENSIDKVLITSEDVIVEDYSRRDLDGMHITKGIRFISKEAGLIECKSGGKEVLLSECWKRVSGMSEQSIADIDKNFTHNMVLK